MDSTSTVNMRAGAGVVIAAAALTIAAAGVARGSSARTASTDRRVVASAAGALAGRQLSSVSAHAPPLEVRTQFGGDISTVAARGNLLYAGVGSRIEVYDVVDPDRPEFVGSTAPLPAQVQAIDFDGSHLFAAVYRGGLLSFAIGSRGIPAAAGALAVPGGSAVGIHVIDGRAYMGDTEAGLVVVDVTRPAVPRLVATIPISSTDGTGLELRALCRQGAVLAAVVLHQYDRQLHEVVLLNVLGQTGPRELGRGAFTASNAFSCVWEGDFVYVGGSSGIHPIDVADPDSPVPLPAVPRPDGASVGSVYSGENRLYQWADLGTETGVVAYGLEDPARPDMRAVHRDGPWGGLLVSPGRLTTWRTNAKDLSERGALGIYTAGSADTIVRRGDVHFAGSVNDATLVGDRLWFTGNGALYHVNAAEVRESPVRWPTGWPVGPIAAANDVILVAEWRQGLRAFDVREPAAPRELQPWKLEPPGVELRTLAADGDRAFGLVWRGRGGIPSDLIVFDTARAAGPALLGSTALDVGWNGLAPLLPLGDTVLVGSDRGASAREISIVDVSDPTAPAELGRLAVSEHVWALARGDGDTVYAGTDSGLLVFDVSDEPPYLTERNRWLAGEPRSARAVRSIAVDGDDVYALTTFGGDPWTWALVSDGLGHGGAVQILQVDDSGQFRLVEEVPVAISFYTSATYRLIPTDGGLAVVGSFAGLSLLGRHLAIPPLHLPYSLTKPVPSVR